MLENRRPFVKGFKYRIYPTAEQQLYLAKIFGSCRYVFNRCLAESRIEYETWFANKTLVPKPFISQVTFIYRLPVWKHDEETVWLKESPAQVLQHACKQAADAYLQFFKRKHGYPRFKSKHDVQSATFSNQIYVVTPDGLKLPKIDSLFKINYDRSFPSGKPGACTISKTKTGKYYASFVCEYEPVKESGSGFVGIDAGITDLAVISDGRSLPNPRYYVTAQRQLCRLQRRLSKKQKGSKNRNKARQKVALLHEHIANQRKDYLHKFTTRIIRENQAICIESLKVCNMLKNHKLAKHIADAGWGEMRRQLVYKAIASQHCTLVLADPYYPSTQLCSTCHHTPSVKIKLGVTKWVCEYCGAVHERDNNASLNLELLARSYRISHGHGIILARPYTPLM